MWGIIASIWLCLLVAAVLGGIIGWLLKTLLSSGKDAEYEARLSQKEAEISRLRSSASEVRSDNFGEIAKNEAEIAAWKKKVSALEVDLAICHDRQGTMEGELKDWTTKAATLSAAGVAVASNGGESSAGLKAEIDTLKAKLAESESEKTYLLSQVKKAESGESIRREVAMEERDDLELIHGVGPVLERMLYDMGIYFFKDIARWDAAKINEITEKLPNFKGRIEREGWVESAKEEHFKKYGERL